jgi:hypothetical protein
LINIALYLWLKHLASLCCISFWRRRDCFRSLLSEICIFRSSPYQYSVTVLAVKQMLIHRILCENLNFGWWSQWIKTSYFCVMCHLMYRKLVLLGWPVFDFIFHIRYITSIAYTDVGTGGRGGVLWLLVLWNTEAPPPFGTKGVCFCPLSLFVHIFFV